jgi:hypothetical protein
MKKYEVRYLDKTAPGAVFMIYQKARTPYLAYKAIKNLGYKPIMIKEYMGLN